MPALNPPKSTDLLRDLIDQQLLLQKGEELGISADTDVVKRLDDLRKQMHADSMEDLEKAAQAQGVSWEEFKQNMKNSIITQQVISQEVGGHITVSQQEIQQYLRPAQERDGAAGTGAHERDSDFDPEAAGGQDGEGPGCAAGDARVRKWSRRPRPRPTRFTTC